jgi:membrane fusion protein, heavy metal efflux system
MKIINAALVLSVLLLAACGEEEPAVEAEFPAETVTQWNGRTELFLEYPARIAGKATGNWAVHLTQMGANFRPVTQGRLRVTFTKPGSAPRAYVAEQPARAGIFTIDPVVPEAGTYRVELALDGPQVRSVHVLPEVRVYANEEQLPDAPAEEAATSAISFLKEQQWVIDWHVQPAAEREIARTVSVPAEIVAPEGSQAIVSAPANGIAVADGNRASPSVGDWVRQGQILVTLAPTSEEGGYARIRENLERLEREAARAQRLYAAGAAPRKRLEEAEHELSVARAEAAAMGGGPDADYRFRVRAPISGQIARRDFLLGGRVAAGEPLFWLVDPTTVRLKAQVPAADASVVARGERATYTLGSGSQPLATGPLLSVGSVVDSASRTVPVFYAMPNAGAGTPKVGQFVRASIPVGGTARGVAIPTSAVLDDAGIPVAYVQVEGESFERRRLRVGPSDGAQVVVLDGIRAGEMVVTTGAYQVRLASMSNTPMSGGHAH